MYKKSGNKHKYSKRLVSIVGFMSSFILKLAITSCTSLIRSIVRKSSNQELKPMSALRFSLENVAWNMNEDNSRWQNSWKGYLNPFWLELSLQISDWFNSSAEQKCGQIEGWTWWAHSEDEYVSTHWVKVCKYKDRIGQHVLGYEEKFNSHIYLWCFEDRL